MSLLLKKDKMREKRMKPVNSLQLSVINIHVDKYYKKFQKLLCDGEYKESDNWSVSIDEPKNEHVKTALLLKLSKDGYITKTIELQCEYKCPGGNNLCNHVCAFDGINCSAKRTILISNQTHKMIKDTLITEIFDSDINRQIEWVHRMMESMEINRKIE